MGDPTERSADPWRRSLLAAEGHADPGTFLVFADLHNHSMLSDGRGDPATAFDQMRAAGLDVAALTDHASIPADAVGSLGLHQYPDRTALSLASSPPHSIDASGWDLVGAVADKFDAPGAFVAIRGFEWTEPWLGHVNVWLSGGFLPVTTPGSLGGLHAWLDGAEPSALFGYNHPGREPGMFGGFPRVASAGLDRGLTDRMVAVEAFNRHDDFLLPGSGAGGFPGWHAPPASAAGDLWSPLAATLDAGWHAGMIGCSDEHGRSYGLTGKGRTGLWVQSLTRAGVRAALLSRRAFATREAGLRLDAALNGVAMGGTVSRLDGEGLAVDVDRPGHAGRPIELQVLTSDGAGRLRVGSRTRARVGGLARATIRVADAAGWLMLRVADPALPSGMLAPAGHPGASRALAYASPWFTSALE